MSERQSLAKGFLKKVLPAGGVESVLGTAGGLESMAVGSELVSGEETLVRGTLESLARDRELSNEQQFVLEAIIIPDRRPAIDVVKGDFDVKHPDWLHFGKDPIRGQIRKALPSIGRVEVSGIPNMPYAGTGFVVGDGLLMTNRHVAEVFSTGLGRKDLVFRPGTGAGVDFKRERGNGEKQYLRVREVALIHPYWDMALLRVDGLTDRNPPLTLALEDPKRLDGRDVAVIGYPAFDPRNPSDVQNKVFGGVYYVKRLQPGKLGARRSTRSFGRDVSAMTHDASTLGGNSGSAVLDVSSGQIVALHFAGLYLDANFSVPSWELSRDRRLIESGVRFGGPVTGDGRVTDGWWGAVEGAPEPDPVAVPAPRTSSGSSPRAAFGGGVPPGSGDGITLTVPVHITVRIGGDSAPAATASARATPAASGAVEKAVVPVHDDEYSTREGYASGFLGIEVPLPEPVDDTLCAENLSDGGYVLPYHHFSLVMHRGRRLALLAASNLDSSPRRKKPEPQRRYTRDALGGLGPKDTERWFTDPRVAPEHQLPDRFFSKDKGAFDRGHIVRREDVAWGDTYEEVQLANGDTFHTTNCSPQVADYNQSRDTDNWGDLEKYVSRQIGKDRLSLFAGPVLASDDPIFVGVDDEGPVRVQIPKAFWKVVVAEDAGGLRAFAFLLTQDLSDVPLEFAVSAEWRQHMVTIRDLEDLLGTLRFPEAVRKADQAGTDAGEAVRLGTGIEMR